MICLNCGAEIGDDSRYCSRCATPIGSSHDRGDSATVTMVVPAGDLPPGTLLAGKYKIIDVAGRGGMGIVYRAEDTKLHRQVALKFLPPEFVCRPEYRERLLVEACAAAALAHPNICTIYEIHDAAEKPFIAMEYIEGRTLRAIVKDRPLDAGEAVELAVQVAEALEEAHRKGVIHRDIKSANIMVKANGQAKIMDFGLAKVRGETLHTREGTTLGTVAYMSPEQARGEGVDHRTDLWALGVVLYEMLSGRLPFMGDRDTSILYSVLHEEPKALEEVRPGVPRELQRIVSRALRKDVTARYGSAAEMASDLKKYCDAFRAEMSPLAPRALLARARRPKIAIPAVLLILAVGAAAAWFFHRQARILWAREQAIPEIERLVAGPEAGYANYSAAYALASEAERYIPGDAGLARLLQKCSTTINIKSDPPGASVSIKAVGASDDQWRLIGVSPIEKFRIPLGFYCWKFEKQGYETVLAVAPTFLRNLIRREIVPYHMARTMDPKGKIPPGMVRVPGRAVPALVLSDFFVDRYEVTNRQFKEFVDGGGYRNRAYWRNAFTKNGKTLGWEEAMAEFVDQTGRPGPSTWEAGACPKGQEDYPVSGVSWYEAAAYAEYAGKSLPTLYHWGLAAGLNTPGFGAQGLLYQGSNFRGQGPVRVGSYPSVTAYGAYDMPGNVREWCWNEGADGRVIRGGAWNDFPYMTGYVSQARPFDRSPKNGFRCVAYPDRGRIPDKAFEAFGAREGTPLTPVSDSVYQVYKEALAYDRKDLNASVESRDDRSADWVREKVTVDAAYGNERLPIYLFLPKKGSPPFQTVVYFPGSATRSVLSSEKLDQDLEFEWHLSFLVRNGRAVVFPIYKGTFERHDDALSVLPDGTRRIVEYGIQLAKDFKRCLDYLETRPDIDGKKLAYMGFSWGGNLSSMLLAGEDRVRASVVILGGAGEPSVRPEVNSINYVTRVTVPTLMLNGKYDLIIPFEQGVKRMFDLLGTPADRKALKVYETDHFIPHNELVKETLAWFDRYLGPVK